MLTFLTLVGIAVGLFVLAWLIEGCLELVGFSETGAQGLRQLLYFVAFVWAIHHLLQ